jgi:Flp pilus assembly pilin Flp
MYPLLGFAHATAFNAFNKAHRRFAADEGQGTVEYIGLILLLAGVMVAVVSSGTDSSLSKTIVEKVKGTIDSVGNAANGKR